MKWTTSFYLFLFLFFSSCSSGAQQTASTDSIGGQVSIEAFEQALAKVQQPQLIDVRTPEEFTKGHLEGATNINWNAPTFESSINQLDKSQPVFIYCQAGGRSGKAYKKMKALGFSTVYDMQGGYGKYSTK